MRLFFALPALLLLTGCAVTAGQAAIGAGGVVVGSAAEREGLTPVPPRAEATAGRVANNIRDNIKATAQHIEDWWHYEPEVKPPHAVPDSYCYRTYGDVLCYRSPMPGWEHRLVGYQGTFAQAPPPAVMEPLPGKTVDESKLPENRLAEAKPVFLAIPEAAEEEIKNPTELVPLDTVPQHTQETVNPALAPQL